MFKVFCVELVKSRSAVCKPTEPNSIRRLMNNGNSKLAALKEQMAARAQERAANANKERSAPAAANVDGPEKETPEGGAALDRIRQRLEERAERKSAEAADQAAVSEEAAKEKLPEAQDSKKKSQPTTVVAGGSPSRIGTIAAPPASGDALFAQLVQDGKELASGMEKDQAEAPMAGYFSELPADPAGPWSDVALIALSPKACREALSWLTHLPSQFFAHPRTRGTALTEISFQSAGFHLEGDPGSEKVSADNLLEFAEALKDQDATRSELARLTVPASSALSGIKIYLPGDSAAVLDRPAVISRISAKTNFLIVAGDSQDQMDSDFEKIVSSLGASMEAVLPVVFAEPDVGECEWLRRLEEKTTNTPLASVAVDAKSMRPQPKDAISAELRVSLSGHLMGRRLKSGIDLIAERQTIRERDTRKRQADAQRMQRQLDEQIKGSNSASRELLDELRQKLDEQVNSVQEWSKARNKRQFSPTGDYTALAAEITDQMSEEHLEKVESAAARRFELPECVREAIDDEVGTRLQTEVNRSVEEVGSRLSTYGKEIEERLEEFHRHPISIELPELNEREIWRDVSQYCEIDSKVGIDLPKRDALRMFMSGSRQLIMPVTMILGGPLAGLIYMIAGVDRQGVTQNPLFVGLLVGLMFTGIFCFIRNARQLDREKMTQSVEKMRETVRTKILREMERVEKEKMEVIQTFLSKVKDELQSNLRKWVDEAISASQRCLERESVKVKSASVILQKRVRDIDQCRREVESLKGRSQAMLDLSTDRLATAIG
jgi:gas vesicle protein